MSANRLATRLAVREARRRPFRSLLVIALVGMPVMGMTVATTLIRTESRTPLETWDDTWGSADLVGHSGGLGQASDDADGFGSFEDHLPAGSRGVLLTTAKLGVRDETHKAFADFISGDVSAPMLNDRFTVIEGRTARTLGEVAVNRATADRFDVEVGQPLHLSRPGLTLDVVGIIEDRECVRCTQLFVLEVAVPAAVAQFVEQSLLIDLPGEPSVETLTAYQNGTDTALEGLQIGYLEPRPIDGLAVPDDWSTGALRWSIVIGALVLAVVGIVIAAAFAVGARRQLVLLGQLSANGAPEGLLRRMLVLQGTVTGIVGSVVGITMGIAGVHLFRGTVENLLDRHLGSFDLDLRELAVIGAIGVVGASVAARIPARTAARIPTLHALAGRRPIERVRARLTGSGLFAMATGLGFLAVATIGGRSGRDGNVWAAVAIIGGLGVLFGATSLTPAMVERLEPLAGRARGSTRIAARSLARNRTRTGAVIAAVAAAGALAVGGTAAARAVDTGTDYTRLAPSVAMVENIRYTEGEPERRPLPPSVVSALSDAIPSATLHRTELLDVQTAIEYPDVPGEFDGFVGGDTVLVVDDALAEGMRLSARVRRALDDDGIVVVDYDDGTPVDVLVTLGDRPPITAQLRFSRFSLNHVATGIYVTPEFAAMLSLPTTPGPVVVASPAPFSEVELFDLSEVYGDGVSSTLLSPAARTAGESIDLQVGHPDTSLDARRLELLLAAVSVAFALIVVAIGLALAAADERDEREVLTVAGAGPGVLSRVSGSKAWILATLGFALAVPVGYLPAATVISVDQGDRALYFPTSVVLTLVVAAPLVVGALAFAVSSVTRRVRPVRISMATFD